MKQRALEMKGVCEGLPGQMSTGQYNITDLDDFGILDALNEYKPQTSDDVVRGACQMPPPTECDVETFSIIIMGYEYDRLNKLKWEIWQMLEGHYGDLMEEIILIWNNPAPLESWTGTDGNAEAGKKLVKMDRERTYGDKFRIWYPLLDHFPNDLFNRYHPELAPRSKAVLYFDDDGPYGNPDPINVGFELWKRNSDAQVGYKPRMFKMMKRQLQERTKIVKGKNVLNDREFQSHCRGSGDNVVYNTAIFPHFLAHMVLPSGSFLHRNYLCWLWHPALDTIRRFVRDHPVHPDDIVVSTIITQLSGRSPVTYPARINFPPKESSKNAKEEKLPRRRLLWEDISQWGDKRSMAVNSVLSYFGSVGTGSAIGWCVHTPYRDKNRAEYCNPKLPTSLEMIPWMNPGEYMADVCPQPPKVVVDKIRMMYQK
jgi:hypothetical protein